MRTSGKFVAFTLTSGMAVHGIKEVVDIDQLKQIHPDMEPLPQFIQSPIAQPYSGSIPASGEPILLDTQSRTTLRFVFT